LGYLQIFIRAKKGQKILVVTLQSYKAVGLKFKHT